MNYKITQTPNICLWHMWKTTQDSLKVKKKNQGCTWFIDTVTILVISGDLLIFLASCQLALRVEWKIALAESLLPDKLQN